MFGPWVEWEEMDREEIQTLRQRMVEDIIRETESGIYSDLYLMFRFMRDSWRRTPYMHPDEEEA